ncbi:phage tail sheath family protein [Sphingomonas psychrotolerans]|uniref:Phage tail protein n=1 Tax=Sphingomonas psychrotolerans TaxID=1327635 RepID=A0A2K8MIB7_9SPHN|nr:phage tail sheath subtilisin-like domain-containing protein [Sphingomonas psychrotolerans]ATY30921.1 hypothetical protein CVN68_02070 [Sphingomonas psychrotolerans]
MPEYLHPGVYIEETSYRGKPIQGVSTSTAGFVGAARKGPEGKAVFVPSFAHFRRLFGDPVTAPAGLGDYLGHSVKAFFENGGARCYVVRALAADALASTVAIEQGTALRLVDGAVARGPTRQLRLNSLRSVAAGSVLNVYTRVADSAPWVQTRTLTVESYDAVRGIATVDAASELPSGVVLDPVSTVFFVDGVAPANTNPGGGPEFTARHRGVDGDAISVLVRPRDRPAVALTAAGARRVDPTLDIAPAGLPLAAAQTTIEFTAPALRRLQTGDTISIGGSSGRVVQAVADGDVTFDNVGAGIDLSGGGVIRLIDRGGALDTPLELGAAPPAFAIDMTVAGPFGPTALPHDLAALLRPGDIVQVDDGGGNTGDVTISAVRVAEEIAPGAHVTLDSGLTAAEPPTARLTATVAAAGLVRLYVGDATGFAAPQRAGSPEAIAIRAGASTDTGHILLADAADNVLYLARPAGEFPTAVDTATWTDIDGLQAVADGQATVRVASTASFYSGAKVELDSGSEKFELIVLSVDAGSRTVTFVAGPALGAGNFIDLPADTADRRAYLRTSEIDVLVAENNVIKETFEGLTWNDDTATDAGLRFFAARINDAEIGSKLVTVVPAAGAGTDFADAPLTANGGWRSLGGGSNGSALTDMALIGEDNGPGKRTGIHALAERDDIAMVAVPGVTLETVQAALITHAELLRYRVAMLDCPPGAADVTEVQAHRNNYDSKYAAYYAPWLRALNDKSGRIESFPPAAYAMGICARTDNSVGVHKAPANEVVRNVVDVALPFTAAEQDVLNPVGVNLIRDLTPRGIRLWGARTISSDQEWKYLNFRRLFIFIEHSLDIGTQWVVFEPNAPALWKRVVETITPFLVTQWKAGALFGTTPEEAFFVHCDETTMTQDDIDNGRLVCEIGLAPVAPAEFVIFRIGQFTASTKA